MAIQPVDLQLAYLAAPASAAAANAVQQGPANAQQAAQATFAAQFEQREETIEETPRAEGAKIRPDRQGGGAGAYQPRKRRRGVIAGEREREDADRVDDDRVDDDRAHFIDTTA